jgi:hypothetical protein
MVRLNVAVLMERRREVAVTFEDEQKAATFGRLAR